MQFVIYKEMRERFSSHIWLDIVSKCDLLQASPVIFATDECNIDDVELVRYRTMGPDGALHVSVKNEIGLHEVPFCYPYMPSYRLLSRLFNLNLNEFLKRHEIQVLELKT